MKIVIFKRVNLKVLANIIIILSVLILISFIINIGSIKHVSVSTNIDKYKIQNELLLDAMNYVGVCNPNDVAKVWSEGLRLRNAAMQYSVMTKELKVKYKEQVEKSFPNLVTGVSSPFIDSFNNIKIDSNNNYIFHIEFKTKTSTGLANKYNAKIIVVKVENFWQISDIFTDKELNVYTGYNLNN